MHHQKTKPLQSTLNKCYMISLKCTYVIRKIVLPEKSPKTELLVFFVTIKRICKIYTSLFNEFTSIFLILDDCEPTKLYKLDEITITCIHMHTLTFNYNVIKKISPGAQFARRYRINNHQLLETYMHSFKVS